MLADLQAAIQTALREMVAIRPRAASARRVTAFLWANSEVKETLTGEVRDAAVGGNVRMVSYYRGHLGGGG
jgi:hypothetical protein